MTNQAVKLEMVYKTTEKFHQLKNDIPYEQDTRVWHIFLDISSVVEKEPKEVDVDLMMRIHGTDWKYYDLDIGVLVEDGFLEIIYDGLK